MATLEIDPDVQAVVAFMQRNVPAARLASVADAISKLSRLLWGQYETEAVAALRLREPAPTSDRDPHTRSAASGSCLAVACAGDDSGEERDRSH